MISISEAATQSGLPAKTIRYYESIGLVYPPQRGNNGYRRYDQGTVRILQFVRRARGLGFSVEECRNLLSLYQDKNRASAEVKRLTKQRVVDIDNKIAELTAMRTTLTQLIDRCQGGQRPDCPILEDLAQSNIPPP